MRCLEKIIYVESLYGERKVVEDKQIFFLLLNMNTFLFIRKVLLSTGSTLWKLCQKKIFLLKMKKENIILLN